MNNFNELQGLKTQLEKKIKSLEEKQKELLVFYDKRIQQLKQILNNLSQNISNLNRTQINEFIKQISDYLKIDEEKKQPIFFEVEKPENKGLLEGNLKSLKCEQCQGSSVSYFYIGDGTQFGLCVGCSQMRKEKNGYKIDAFQQLYFDSRNKIIQLQEMLYSHDQICEFQDKQNQILEQFKFYFLSKISGYLKYVKEMVNFKQLNQNEIVIGESSIRQLCQEIALTNKWELNDRRDKQYFAIKDALSEYFKTGITDLSKLNGLQNICVRHNSQFNTAIVYHNIKQEVKWIDLCSMNKNISFYDFIEILKQNAGNTTTVDKIQYNNQSIGTSWEKMIGNYCVKGQQIIHFDIWAKY